MKQTFLLLALTSFMAFSSCDKKTSTPNNPAPTNNAISFNVNGIGEIKIPANKDGTMALAITHVSGIQENVTLSLSGLPAKVTHEFSTGSGIPTFSSVLSLTADMATPGSYQVTLTATSASGIVKNYTFNLVIQEPLDCASNMTGNFSGTKTCQGTGNTSTTMTATKDAKLYGLILKLDGIDADIKASLNCENNTFAIAPFEVQYSSSIIAKGSGSGTFVSPGVLNFSITTQIYSDGNLVNTSTCNYVMTK